MGIGPEPFKDYVAAHPKGGKRCCCRVFTTWRPSQCWNRGKFEEGGHFWCGHHLPSRVAAKEAKSKAKWEADWARTTRFWDADKVLRDCHSGAVELLRDVELALAGSNHAGRVRDLLERHDAAQEELKDVNNRD